MAQAFPHRKYYYDFDPRSIGGCAAWFDGSDSNTIVYDTSGRVSAWLDKTGNNRHLTQSTSNNRPGYRLSGVDISSGFQRLDTSGWLSSNYELYAVGFPDISENGPLQTLAMMKNNQRLFAINIVLGTDGRKKVPVHSNTTTWATCPDVRVPFLVSANVNNSLVSTLRVNGSQSTTGPTFVTTADISTIGNDLSLSRPFGVVNELLLYFGTHTIKQRRLVEGYLSHKWRFSNTFLGQPSQGFVPTDISGCSLWLDANDDTKFDLSGPASNSVWVWKDKSGNGWDVSQALSAGRPTYVTTDQYKYVNFTAASTQRIFFNTTFLSNRVFNRSFSFFAVVTNDPTQANNCFFGATVNSSRNQLIAGWRSGILGFGFNGDDGNMNIGDQMTSNAWVYPKVIYFEHNSASQFEKRMYSNGLFALRQNGGSNLLGATSQCIGFAHLGLTQPYYNGRVCEVLFYDRPLSTSQLQTVNGYLMNKWQVPPFNPFVFPNHEAFLIRNPVVRDFRPSDIRNCILWLDAADPTSYTLNSNNVLTAWRDKSSNRNDAIDICGSPVYAFNSSNGKYGFYFDQPSLVRGNIRLGSNIFTAFLAAAIDSSGATRGRIFGVSGRQDISDTNDASGITFIAKTSTINQVCYMKGGTSERAPCDSSWNTPNVIISGYDTYIGGTGQQMLHNNGVRGTTGARSVTIFAPTKYALMGTTGCNYQDNGNGFVFEAILYHGFLNYAEMDQVQTYLGRKWGIDISSGLYRANVPPVSIAERPNAVSLDTNFSTQAFNCILWLDAMDSNTYSVSNNFITRLESKSVFGGSLTTSLGATYLPGYNATGLNGRPCFTTSTTNPGPRLYGSYGYAAANWAGVRSQHTVFMVVEATSDLSGLVPRIFSSWGGSGNDSTTGTGFAIATSNTTSPFTISPLRFSAVPTTSSNIIPYRNPTTFTTGVPTILSYNGQNDGGNHTPTTWAIGSVANTPTVTSNIWNLKVSEVLAFQFAPSATETQAIEGYLARKWGIDLCTNHTYKYVRP
jgi:hypothetical protein